MFLKTLVCVLAAAGSIGAARGQGTIPPEKLVAFNKQAALEFEQKNPMLKDEEVSGYLGRLAQRLARAASLDSATVKVVNSTEGRAQTLPGGFVYIDAGLILKADTERDLAGTLAHLMAHLANPQRVTGMATIPLVSTGCSRFGFVPRTFEKFEPEADRLGQKYVEDAGYDTSVLDPEFDRIKERVKRAALAQPASDKKPTLKRDGN